MDIIIGINRVVTGQTVYTRYTRKVALKSQITINNYTGLKSKCLITEIIYIFKTI